MTSFGEKTMQSKRNLQNCREKELRVKNRVRYLTHEQAKAFRIHEETNRRAEFLLGNRDRHEKKLFE